MKQIHVITSLSVGGAEKALFRLLTNMMPEEVMVISLTSKGKVGVQLEEHGFQVRVLGLNFYNLPTVFYKLYYLIKNYQPDIVQSWLYHADLIGGLAAKLAGVKNIIWNIRTTELRKSAFVTSVIRKICARLSFFIPVKIVVVAHRSRLKHIQLGYNASIMEVIPNGFITQQYAITNEEVAAFKDRLGIKDFELVIGCVGRLSQVKGQDIFIDAANKVLETIPTIRFLMIGRGIEVSNHELISLFKNNEILSRFIFLGERSDISLCLKSMDIFCLPSRSEGFPNVLGEAMLAGVPCVSTDVGDAAILGGKEVPLVDINNSQSLADELILMARKSAQERIVIGKGLRERIVDQYSVKKMVIDYQKLYESLVCKNKKDM